jgi:hypothetical protein
LKSALKAGAAAGKCSSSGLGNGDYMTCTISGDFNLNFATLRQAPPAAAVQSSHDLLTIAGASPVSGGPGVAVGVAVTLSSVTGTGTYSVNPGAGVTRADTGAVYLPGTGTITFTTFDLANQKLAGTFGFTAPLFVPTGSGSVTVSSGTFSISKIMQQ